MYACGHFTEYQLYTLKALCILVIIGNIPLIVCHLFYVIGRYYIICYRPYINIDIIKYNNAPVCFFFVADEVLSDGTQQHSTGRGYVILN